MLTYPSIAIPFWVGMVLHFGLKAQTDRPLVFTRRNLVSQRWSYRGILFSTNSLGIKKEENVNAKYLIEPTLATLPKSPWCHIAKLRDQELIIINRANSSDSLSGHKYWISRQNKIKKIIMWNPEIWHSSAESLHPGAETLKRIEPYKRRLQKTQSVSLNPNPKYT